MVSALINAFPNLTQITPIPVRSGQKDVFRANQGTIPVALKVIRDAGDSLPRIEREIAAVAKLESDYVPRIHSHGWCRCPDERYYVIEQFISGRNYQEVLARCRRQHLPDVLHLGEVLLRACVDFEAARLVHRDIKPANLMQDLAGKVWVLDFGIARHLDLVSLTPTGPLNGIGTLGYAPPEQFRNFKPAVDARTDLYSIGVVLYESINGSNPYLQERDIVAIFRKMESEDLPRLAIPDDPLGLFSEFVSALTARFPSRRPQTAREAWQWFTEVRSAFAPR